MSSCHVPSDVWSRPCLWHVSWSRWRNSWIFARNSRCGVPSDDWSWVRITSIILVLSVTGHCTLTEIINTLFWNRWPDSSPILCVSFKFIIEEIMTEWHIRNVRMTMGHHSSEWNVKDLTTESGKSVHLTLSTPSMSLCISSSLSVDSSVWWGYAVYLADLYVQIFSVFQQCRPRIENQVQLCLITVKKPGVRHCLLWGRIYLV